MRVFIPGGGGFLGKAVRDRLLVDHHQVVVGGRSPVADVYLDAADMDRSQLEQVLAGVGADVVLNLVGTGLSSADVSSDTQTAVNGVWPSLIANYVRDHDDITLVHVASSTELSTDHEGHFESLYSKTKALGSQAILDTQKEAPDQIALVYAHNIYGPTQPKTRLVRWLIDQAESQSKVALRFPNRVRDFIYMEDAAEAIALSTTDPVASHGREVGTGQGTRLRDLAHSVFTQMGADPGLIESQMTSEPDPFEETIADPNNLLRSAAVELQDGLVRTINEMEGFST